MSSLSRLSPGPRPGAGGTQLLPRSDRYVVVRGWDQASVLAGEHAVLAGRIVSAVGDGRSAAEVAAATGVPETTVAAIVHRLRSRGLVAPVPPRSAASPVTSGSLSRSRTGPVAPATAEPVTAAQDSVLTAVVADAATLGERLAAELHGPMPGPDVLVVGEVGELVRSAAGAPVHVVLPRDVVERGDPAVHAMLLAGGRWACYWREPDRTVITSDLSGPSLCLGCLQLRERAGGPGVSSPRRGDPAPGDADAGPTAALLAHVARGLRAGAGPEPVVYELRSDRVERSRVLGLPVCRRCTVDTGRADTPRAHGALLPAQPGPFGHLPHRTGAAPGSPAVVAADSALTFDQLVDRCRRSGDLPADELDALIRDLTELFGRRGVLRAVQEERPAIAAECFRAVAADLTDLRRISASNAAPQAYDAFGASWTMAGAVQRCLGEAVERYCALVQGAAQRVTWGTAAELADAVPVRRFATLSAAEIQGGAGDFRAATANSRLGWVAGRSLVSEQPVLVPAQLSLLGYTAASSEDVVQPSSNKGLAAGRDTDRCLAHGLCELIEADALLIHFLNRSPVPELDLSDTGSARIDEVRRELRDAGGQLRAWDFATDIAVPTVLAVIERHDGAGPVATFGMATRTDPAGALEKAVLEALHATCWLTGPMLEAARAHPGLPAPDWVTARERAKSLGASPAYLAELGWLLDRDVRRPFREYAAAQPAAPRDPAGRRRRVVDTLAAVGLEPLAVDLSTPDVRSATGHQVWRSVVPGLQPFSIGVPQARANDRLYSVPVRMGHRSSPAAESDLNPLPHPCP